MMAEARRYPLGNQLDIQQILVEAQHRWLRPAEICEILSNYKKFRINPEPAHLPPSGSLFLFDRKVLRYFRKDGHNWRKKNDGKTVKEAHERLKSGSIDVLHCYYAHGGDNENFQRRSYWMLEEELSHIVLVHYREVKVLHSNGPKALILVKNQMLMNRPSKRDVVKQGNRVNFNRIKESSEAVLYSQDTEDSGPNSEMDISVSSNLHPNDYHAPTRTTDTTSMNSAHASEYEDAESAYNQQVSSRFHSFLESPKPTVEKIDIGSSFPSDYQGRMSSSGGLSHEPQKHLNLPLWNDVLDTYSHGYESMPFTSLLASELNAIGVLPKQEEISGELCTSSAGKKQEDGSNLLRLEEWQTFEDGASHLSKWTVDQKLHTDSTYDVSTRFHEQELGTGGWIDGHELLNLQDTSRPLLDDPQMKKLDSFNRWMYNELGDVKLPNVQSSDCTYWDAVESERVDNNSNILVQAQMETCMMGPSLSTEQLFNIIDFSPNWADVGSQIKVLIKGRFLKTQEERKDYKWSCMFGEIEVPAEVIADGVLRCHTPLLKAGRVPFYVTCSNRVACSEVREFEYRVSDFRDVNTYSYGDSIFENLQMRFGKLLCLSSLSPAEYDSNKVREISQLSSKIDSLLKEDDDGWDRILNLSSDKGLSLEAGKEQLLQKLLKEKLHGWLLQKAAEGGKGPSVLDEGGLGVLHFAAALGYDWALEPTIAAGVSVNYRDINGWTALHWAASYGRERTIASLIHLGAAPGALTDPTPEHPTGRTPADLASAYGHKGIAGFLAESALSAHLSSLNLHKQDGDAAKAVDTVSEHCRTPVSNRELPYGLSLKDSLAAVCNATQTAARIHQVFRVQSFQKKQLREYGDDEFGMSNERTLSLIAIKSQKAGQRDEPVHAAIKIQNKFRGWKGRKEFLMIRKYVVKIQAHVRGHQVRKNYRMIVWSVGIVEKIILRWRRKRSGLRGFKSEGLIEGPIAQGASTKDDEYDFLKEGRRQTEERSQIALARVKSMHQYPEARDQYRRLRNVVTEIQENKAMYGSPRDSERAAAEFDDSMDLATFLDDDDSFMPS